MFDAVIVSGGRIERDFAYQYLYDRFNEKRPLMIAADHGLDFFKGMKYVPDIAIGDFDSVSETGKLYMKEHPEMEIIRLKPEKDDSDTQSACRLAFERGAEDVLILGATGSRIDHVISNIGLLTFAREQGKKVTLIDANNHIELIEPGSVIRKSEQFGKYVSFFPLGTEIKKLSLSGFKYPLHEYTFRSVDCGLTVSNEMVDEFCRVEFESGNLLMIQSRD